MRPEEALTVEPGELLVFGMGPTAEVDVVVLACPEGVSTRFYVRADEGLEGWVHQRVLRRPHGKLGYEGDPERVKQSDKSREAIFEATRRKYGKPGPEVVG